MTKITRDMYRLALHVYLIHSYPDDDVEYYSKYAWLAHPTFWRDMNYRDGQDVPGIHREARFGCHVSGNTKLRCYPTGFMFDTNHVGDPDEVIEDVKRIRKEVEDHWERLGLPVCGRDSEDDDDPSCFPT